MAAHNVLKSKPKQKDLEKIKKKVGDKWRSLLTNLGEEEATIQGFLGNSHGSTTEACFKGLVHWLEGNADHPVTWETLLKALKESELKGFADDLEEELKGESQGDQNGGQSKLSASKDPEEKFPVLKTSQEFMKYFQENFLAEDVVQSVWLVEKLYNEEVIPKALKNVILKSTDEYKMTSDIFNHVKGQGDYESLTKLCKCMINHDGHRKMDALGKKMLKCLEANKANFEKP